MKKRGQQRWGSWQNVTRVSAAGAYCSLGLIVFFLFISCAPVTGELPPVRFPYGGPNGSDDYADLQLDANTFRIESRVRYLVFNGLTEEKRNLAERRLLDRCAEVTLNNNFDYFLIGGGDRIYSQSLSSERTVNTGPIFHDNYDVLARAGRLPDPARGYSANVIIRMFKGSKPDNMPSAYDARAIVAMRKSEELIKK